MAHLASDALPKPRWALRLAAVVAALSLVGACAMPELQPPGDDPSQPAITLSGFRMEDGRILPYRHWRAENEQAVILALHGFNDYSFAWEMPGPWWASQGLTTYAYDQRGFGQTAMTGLWPGEARLVADLCQTARLIEAAHPGKPIVAIGESMGGAVVMATLADGCGGASPIKAAVLSAPAVWGRASMNIFMRSALWFFSHTMPAQKFTGRDLGIRASDNIEMLRALGRDPLFIKATRADAIWGVVNMMDLAAEATPKLKGVPMLLLYGAKDEVIPRRPVAEMLARLPDGARIAYYANGWHLLFRDLQREIVWRDVAAWIRDPNAGLPSGAERVDRKLGD